MTNRLSLILAVLLAGCARPAGSTFLCPDGTELRAVFSVDSVRLRLPDGMATLPIAISASGARYANDTLVFWEHQGAARVEHRGQVRYVGCRRLDGAE